MEMEKYRTNKSFDTELLIELVKRHPQLYSSAFKVYRCKTICSDLWKDIAGVLDKDVAECKTVWTSLRSSYTRHLKNLRRNERGIKPKYKKHWYLADKMEFLHEHIRPSLHDIRLYQKSKRQNQNLMSVDDNSTSFSNLESKSDSQESSEINISTHEDTASKSNCSMRENKTENVDCDENFSAIKCRRRVEQLTSKDPTTSTPQENKKEPPKVRGSEQPILMTKDDTDDKACEDSATIFFESILFDLRKLSNKKLRFFKQEILKDLNKYMDEEENEYYK